MLDFSCWGVGPLQRILRILFYFRAVAALLNVHSTWCIGFPPGTLINIAMLVVIVITV